MENSATPLTICTPYWKHTHTNNHVSRRSPQQISPVGPHDWLKAQLHTFLQPWVPSLPLFFFCPSFCAVPSHLFFNHQNRCLLFSSATLSASHLYPSLVQSFTCVFPFTSNTLNEITGAITMTTVGQTLHTRFHLKNQQNKKKVRLVRYIKCCNAVSDSQWS